MQAIFYDLETTDTRPIGQILNYSFILVDEKLAPVDELSGEIRISRLELPTPEAILANRVDVLEHQKRAKLSEPEAMAEISRFVESARSRAGQGLVFLGYNSQRFDLAFLRTSLARNGCKPYFGGKIIYRDLLHLSRKLSASHPKFPRTAGASLAPGSDRESRLALTLENLTQRLGLLSGRQTHMSRDDVVLSIELARCYRAQFGLDLFRYDPYEPNTSSVQFKPGDIVVTHEPNYDLTGESIYLEKPHYLLDVDYRYALWLDLDAYQSGEGRRSIHWHNKNGSDLFLAEDQNISPAWKKIAATAKSEFKDLNLKNFFTVSKCYIEQDIYRLDFDALDAVAAAIQRRDLAQLTRLKNTDASTIYRRYELANYERGSASDPDFESRLKKYAEYRYGGKLAVSKHPPGEGEEETFHPTMAALMERLDARHKTGTAEDRALLASLKKFYLDSELWQAVSA